MVNSCPQWDRLQKRHVIRRPDRIRAPAAADPACIFAFDLLWLDGDDYRARPLTSRKAMLRKVLASSKRICYANHVEDTCDEVWALAEQFELEGVVAKRAESIYRAGRTNHWLKFKTALGAARERARRPR
jgi:bifunctional non-homologous end joining protein LigD